MLTMEHDLVLKNFSSVAVYSVEYHYLFDILIFLKHNSLCERAIRSSQLSSQSIPCTNYHVRVTLFACTLRARS